MMQELMKSLEQGRMVANEVVIGAPPTFTAPDPESLAPGEEMELGAEMEKAWFDWFASMDAFERSANQNVMGSPQMQAPGAELPPHSDKEMDAPNNAFFPPLPIVSPVLAPQPAD